MPKSSFKLVIQDNYQKGSNKFNPELNIRQVCFILISRKLILSAIISFYFSFLLCIFLCERNENYVSYVEYIAMLQVRSLIELFRPLHELPTSPTLPFLKKPMNNVYHHISRPPPLSRMSSNQAPVLLNYHVHNASFSCSTVCAILSFKESVLLSCQYTYSSLNKKYLH